MRYLLFSDVHANLEALEAVLRDAAEQPHDRILCLGDVVGYGPDPNECAARLADLGAASLAGNHDLAALGRLGDEHRFNPFAAAALRWTAAALAPRTTAFLSALPSSREFEGVLAVHASPSDPVSEYVTDAGIAARNFRDRAFDLCVHGHTHIPCAFLLEGDRVRRVELAPGEAFAVPPGVRAMINVGSVGQPRDGDPRAAYAILDLDARAVTLHRVAYAIKRTQEKMAAARLPAPLIARLAVGM